ncbi:Rad52/22 family double-strand break repair protein [Edaphobacter aggregans]|uniref:Rad52/22 family double-strand break repair protein n=1 Tax=Edaphobacter aggregans TaxID=570835 RepID=A0A3R9PVL5_9BACT|nr:Rad52/Rad22 family DNA repair protein [Edaphobacter aggregans]RSL18849.1 Rad52/22 family double-strand break repair protein [Edaphobacter aggregans]
METNTQEIADVLLRLQEPFDPDEVKWLVAATSRDGRKGRVTPYANPRAYTDRLNDVLTASGWTRQYAIHTISPVTRLKKDKAIQTGKVLVTCTVTIAGIGSHSGSGEEWADDENAMTSAEAQAFKRACSCFGLGRYFYNFAEMWVDLNENKQPTRVPSLPAWALPKNRASAPQQNASGKPEQRPRSSSALVKGPLDASVTAKIEGHRQELGQALYQSILTMVAQVRSARDIPIQHLQQSVLNWMESATRGMAQVRKIAAEIPETTFYSILDRHGVQSLAEVPNFGVLKRLVDEVQAAPHESAA